MRFVKSFRAGFLVVAIALLFAPLQDASKEHFVITNDGDFRGDAYSTILKLSGSARNPLLMTAARLDSQQPAGGGGGDPSVVVVEDGPDICVFMVTGIDAADENEISSFKYPGLSLVGNYSDTDVPADYYPYVVAASGDYLFVGFSHYIASWAIDPGCTLALLNTTYAMQESYDLAATPNGKTLIGSGFGGDPDSYAIGPNGSLTELGPFPSHVRNIEGLDITADNKFAIFAVFPFCGQDCTTAVSTFLINPDGGLDSEQDFGGDGSLGNSEGVGFVRLSPDEKYLYASGGTAAIGQMITMNFSENPLNVTYTGCTTNLKFPRGESSMTPATVATIGTTGAGKGLYVAETFDVSSVGLLSIDPNTGCTTEAPSSPFTLWDSNSDLVSLVAWPPRPF
jgi:hypothetical protein